MIVIRTIVVSMLLLAPITAPAYIGPGSGLSLFGGLWTLVVGIILALAAILFWPIRYMIRRIRAKKNTGQARDAKDPTRTDRNGE